MGPIGASTSWQWHGYRNSTVLIDGKPIESVSGGGHFGGGLFINTLDHARFGLLALRNGRWGERQLIAEDWFKQATTASVANPEYGYMRSEEHTSELQSLMRISYAVFCLKKKKKNIPVRKR